MTRDFHVMSYSRIRYISLFPLFYFYWETTLKTFRYILYMKKINKYSSHIIITKYVSPCFISQPSYEVSYGTFIKFLYLTVAITLIL